MKTPLVNLLEYDRNALQDFFVDLGEKPYRATQVLKWIHFEGILNPQEMTNLSKALRQTLSERTQQALPEVLLQKTAPDDTIKWILKLSDGNCIETVYIPERTRGTLCVSSQVGCIVDCDFCSTGKQGFSRNLTVGEIISQVWIAVRALSKTKSQHDHAITNVVMMGMGEPLLNFENVVPALRIMLDDYAYGLSKRRVTVSTSGVIPAIYKLREALDVALAVSLHAPDDGLRNELVPLNKKYPLTELMKACKHYFENDRRRSVTMEYVMLAGINDTVAHAKRLIKILTGVRAKVNLIPFNPFPGTTYQRSDENTIERFQQVLLQAELNTTIRRTRGEKIDAACGQLVGDVKDRTFRQRRYQEKLSAKP